MKVLSFEVTGKPAASFVFINLMGTGRLEVEQKLCFFCCSETLFLFFFACQQLNSLAIDGDCRQIDLPHATFSHAQSLHRTDDMCSLAQAQEAQGSIRVACQNRSFIHASCFFLRLTVHWTPAQVLSHLPLLCFCRPLLRSQTCCPRIHLSTVKIHCWMVLLRNSTSQVKKAQEDRAQENSGQTTNQKIDDQDDIEEIGVKPLFYCQSAYDSAGSIATPPDSDLEDEQLRQMLSSPLKLQEWKENEGQARAYHSERQSLMINSSRNPEVSGKPDAECVQKREANAQRIQGNQSKRERLMTSSSRDLEVSGKLDAVLSCHSELSQNTFSERDRSNDPGNRFVSSVHSVFRFADPANVGKSLLDGNKDHLLNQARSEIMKQEH